MKRPQLSELSLKEKISQLLMISQEALLTKRVDGKDVKRTKEEVNEIMSKYQYGSIWSIGNALLTNANMAEVTINSKVKAEEYKKWLDEIGKQVSLPLLIGVDCENGAGGIFSDGTNISTALQIGAADDEKLTYELAASVAKEIKASGANWRWVPVVDITNRYNGVSAGRTYSDDIDKIVKHASAAIKGTESVKVASTVKHFPGSDPYEIRDSHIVPTSINISLEEWRNTQAKTFKGVIDSGVDSVMVGHTAFPAADDTIVNGRYLPATLSEKMIKGLLREELGFDGVVITDAIRMSGLINICPYEEIVIRAINAGNDVILGVKAEDFDVVYQAVLDGRIPMERIDESAERVLKLKEKIGLFDDGKKEEIDISEQAKITAKLDKEIAEKAITMVCDRNNLVPVDKNKIKKVAIVCSSHFSDTITELEVMKKAFEERGAEVELIEEIVHPAEVREMVDRNDLVVYAAYLAPHRPMGMPSLYGTKIETYFNAFAVGKEKSVGVSLGYPYVHIDAMAGADTFFNIYSPAPGSMEAFVRVLYGEIPPSLKSPIDIEPKLRYVFG